ncbi:MAG: hypothetical protein A3I44_03195 [Candidatus Sungbacteria bacterium RIFCSPLOWO2_02_FULL_51_17]|nr:MAG: hypothetical protein A2676_02135 [Candidatus Sungbacteria bacterium RIFCSPHIGHO2_01_FULL_51_22]OHA10990.1 MAG: hypothetical protein A3I44_03195 [Candidatus Sungbacteria bacterium RIFCSPLOWO2_02_FULL_51_17]
MNHTQSLYGLLTILGLLASTVLLFLGIASVNYYRSILGLSGVVLALSFFALYHCCKSGSADWPTDDGDIKK